MKFTNSIYFFIFLFTIACQDKVKEKDCINIDIHNNNITPVFSDLFSKIDIIPLETNDSCLVAQADKIMYRNDTIYILDKMQWSVFAFNGSGQLLWHLSKLGRGPGEYENIEDFVVNPATGNIEIISAPGQYIIYDTRGEVVESYRIPVRAIHQFHPIDQDLTAFYEEVDKGMLRIFSKKENKIISEQAMSENHIVQNTTYRASVTPFVSYAGKVLFLAADQKKIYDLSTFASQIKEYQSFHFGKEDYDVKSLPRDREMTYYHEDNKYARKIYSIYDFKETDECMIIYSIYDEFWHTTFYNKSDHKSITLNKESGIMIYYPFDCNSEALIGVIPASTIERQVKREWVDQEEWDRIQTIPMDANPIVLKYYFRLSLI